MLAVIISILGWSILRFTDPKLSQDTVARFWLGSAAIALLLQSIADRRPTKNAYAEQPRRAGTIIASLLLCAAIGTVLVPKWTAQRSVGSASGYTGYRPAATARPTAAPTKGPTPMSIYNGMVIVQTDYKQTCPLTVKASTDTNYFVLLRYIGKPNESHNSRHRKSSAQKPYSEDIGFIVLAGKSVDIDVPIGKYELIYACGDKFYGTDLLFGESTRLYAATTYFDFYTTKKYYQGHTITLYKVPDGNLETIEIPFSEYLKKD